MKPRFFSILMGLALLILLASPAPATGEDDDDLLIYEVVEGLETEAPRSIFQGDGSAIITISCTGDFTIGGDNYHRKDIFTPELKKHDGDINFVMANTRDLFLEDDLTLVNFEGTLTDTTYVPENKKGNSFLFNITPASVSVLTDNGIEAVSLENNHVMDHGQEGYDETKQTLRDAGIVYSTSEDLGIYEIEGIQVAMMSYLCIDRYNKPVGGYATLFDKVAADITSLKKLYPIVIVSFHWGNEKDYAPTANQFKMGRLAVDSGADLVIGHHSHRMNPIEEYKGVYICYSLGNFCFAGNSKPSDMSSFIFQIRFRLKNREIINSDFRIIPIRISSRQDRNDFIPTVVTRDTTVDSILNVLKENGRKLEYAVTEYPMEWK